MPKAPTTYAIENLIASVREVFEVDLADPLGRLNALEMLACALDLIDDGDPPVLPEDDEDEADVPIVRE